jgi:hypothetical protein
LDGFEKARKNLTGAVKLFILIGDGLFLVFGFFFCRHATTLRAHSSRNAKPGKNKALQSNPDYKKNN